MRCPLPSLLLIALVGCPSPDTDTSGVDDDTDTSADSDTVLETSEGIDLVHISVRTGPGLFDGTDARVELCLSDSGCLSLNHPEFSDRERGGLDTYSFEGLDWRREDLQQVTLRMTDGADNQWKPVCVDVRIGGSPVHCRDNLTIELNEDSPTWTDPDGLAVNCQTCAASTLTHGPMVGALTPDSARIWLRTDASRPVELVVAQIGRASCRERV